jgi:hypothetical protein
MEAMFDSSLHSVVCGRARVLFSYLCFLGVVVSQHIVLCFCFVFLCLVYRMLPVSLDCPCFIAPSIFSNVYLNTKFSEINDIW